MSIYEIPITKAKGKTLSLDSDKDIPDEIYQYIFYLGLKSVLNRGTTSLKRENFASHEAFETEGFKIATDQLAKIKAGTTRIVGGPGRTKKTKNPIHTEELRLARIVVKDEARASGKVKLSNVTAAMWTKTAEAKIASDPETFRKAAEASLAAAAFKPKATPGILPEEDPTLVAKKSKAKAEAEAIKAAKAAGKASPKAKAPLAKAKAKPQAHV